MIVASAHRFAYHIILIECPRRESCHDANVKNSAKNIVHPSECVCGHHMDCYRSQKRSAPLNHCLYHDDSHSFQFNFDSEL